MSTSTANISLTRPDCGLGSIATLAQPSPHTSSHSSCAAGRRQGVNDHELDSAATLSINERAAVVDARARAIELLESLTADRQLIEARLMSGGRLDPMKTVRGASSLEYAISATREMIDAYDAMLGLV